MRLQSLILEQFRNHQKFELHFDLSQPITYLIGENAQGKTNILEAIYLLALTKSFRTNTAQDMIGWEQEWARVKGVFKKNAQGSARADLTELEIFLGKPPHQQKALKKNGVKISSTNFIGSCQMVFFHPEDLNILYLGPDLRRRYLDIFNLQINRKYFQSLRSYRRVLQQRNALLRAIVDGNAIKKDLEIWDDQLVEYGSVLMIERARTVKFLADHLEDYYQKISQKNEKVLMRYTNGAGLADEIFSEDFDEAIFHEVYKKALVQASSKDLKAQFTTVGPHRDDVEFWLNDLPLQSHASRGEYRSLLLALKLLELRFYVERTGDQPLLLLDDVFSELDYQRQSMLLQAIEEHQTIITTTHLDTLVLDRIHGGMKSHQIMELKNVDFAPSST